MIFYSLTFARSRGKSLKPRAKPEVFNTYRGTLPMLTNDKIMFDKYCCIKSNDAAKTKKMLAEFLRIHAFINA